VTKALLSVGLQDTYGCVTLTGGVWLIAARAACWYMKSVHMTRAVVLWFESRLPLREEVANDASVTPAWLRNAMLPWESIGKDKMERPCPREAKLALNCSYD
jgi:hypothetical protein